MKKRQILLNTIIYIFFIIIWICVGIYFLFIAYFNDDIIKSPICILFILAFISSIIFPFYSKSSNPKKTIVSIILALFIFLAGELTFKGIEQYYSVFTPEKWAKNINSRHRMIDSLENQYTLVRKTEDELKNLLGYPDYIHHYSVDNENQYYYNYYLGNVFLSTIYYCVTVENGTVVSARKYVD